jgi:hypothetical protein
MAAGADASYEKAKPGIAANDVRPLPSWTRSGGTAWSRQFYTSIISTASAIRRTPAFVA